RRSTRESPARGERCRGRGAARLAAVAGPLLHAVLDVVPHEDIEISSALFTAPRGPLDPAVIGAITSSAPDLAHIFPLPRLGVPEPVMREPHCGDEAICDPAADGG